MRNRNLFVVAALTIAACGGGGDGGVTPPPPPPADIGVRIVNTDTLISGANPVVSVSAALTQGQVTADNVHWALDGSAVGQGWTAAVAFTPGSHQVCANATNGTKYATACKTFVFTPKFICTIVVADATSDNPASPVHVSFTKSGKTAEKDAVGKDCSIETPYVLGTDSARVVITSPDQSVHPMIAYESDSELVQPGGVTLVAVPMRFAIQSGPFKGQVVPTDLKSAYTLGADSASFYLRRKVQDNTGRYQYYDATYPASSLPIPTVILNKPEVFSSSGVDKIRVALDSANKWCLLASDITQVPVVKDTTPYQGVLTVFKDSVDDNGVPRTNVLGEGNSFIDASNTQLVGGVLIYIRESYIATDLTTHELIHVLGFGHEPVWRGMMSMDSPLGLSETPVPQDYAYIQLKYRVRELENKYHASHALCQAHQGLMVLIYHQAEESCF